MHQVRDEELYHPVVDRDNMAPPAPHDPKTRDKTNDVERNNDGPYRHQIRKPAAYELAQDHADVHKHLESAVEPGSFRIRQIALCSGYPDIITRHAEKPD